MHALEHKIPPPLVATACALLMWGIAQYSLILALAAPLRWGVALLVLLTGAAFCVAGVWSFRQAHTTVNPLKPDAASSLVRTGVYRYSRNPMYVGFALLLLAWACYLAAPWALLGVLAFVLYIQHFQIAPEERALAQIFGDEFQRYRAQVRRWL
ncbi:methyltransferase family protein [Comamonas jiangduensis]|uniref:methyltransferase family protein n=1 Tax=Comamonas jiangduensis TaxID=1194168 RepID=UPI0028A62D86|nr:isoprenylcysteine carboxylmethyltransferase family protein [Comamonas jiangduensis]